MNTINDETLVLFHYGELDPLEMNALRTRMTKDDALAQRYAELAAMLDTVPEPEGERDEFYGRRVWTGIESRLPVVRRESTVSWWRIAGMAAALGIVAITAYQFGQSTAPVTPVVVERGAVSDADRARVIKASLRSHMESASRLFMELENTESMGVVDVEAEKNWAATLLVANRLYRFAAEQAGQERIVRVLEDMEPMLIELANSEHTLTDEEFQALRRRLETNNLTFKASVTTRSLRPEGAGI